LAFLSSFTPQPFGRVWEVGFVVGMYVGRTGKDAHDVQLGAGGFGHIDSGRCSQIGVL
jgi:hypothetical protein